MATINAENPTFHDFIKSKNPDGSQAKVIEMLSQRNTIVRDATAVEGNLDTGHRITHEYALPSIGWRQINQGTTPSKGRTAQVDEACGLMSGLSVIDKELVRLNGGPGFRAAKDRRFVTAMSNEAETGAIYHSTKTAPEKFMGLAPRFAATTDPGGSQLVLADASPSGSDQTSVWLVGWHPEGVAMMFPKGTQAGLESNDLGEQLWDDGTGKKFTAFVTEWIWRIGLYVADWRQVARVCNIDTSALVATVDNIVPAMIEAFYKINDPKMGRFVWYMNRTVATYLHLQSRELTKNSTITFTQSEGGQPIMNVMGIPIHITDAILNTESIIA